MMEINYPVATGENLAVVNIGASITSISVIFGGLTIFTRSIPMGGNQFTEEIQRRLNVSFRDAEAMKTGRAEGAPDPEATEAMLTVSTNLTFEIKRSLDFFLGGVQGSYVNKIYLSGGGARISGLADLMQDKTSIPVEMVYPFKNIECGEKLFSPDMLKDLAPLFGVAVGLATRRFGDR
jgi:type IV pilus assembly protein PilM